MYQKLAKRKSSVTSTLSGPGASSTKQINNEKTLINLPEVNNYEDAPEISHLKIIRPINKNEDEDFNNSTSDFDRRENKCSKCLKSMFTCFTDCFKQEEGDELMDELDPIAPRTCNSLEFLNKLSEEKSKKTLRKSIITNTLNPESSFYKAAYDGLICLNKANDLYKELILVLSFTHYAEEPLKQSEKNMIRGKTVLGSYAWITAYILQQLQFDVEIETTGYSSSDLKEVIKIMEHVACQTLYIWQAVIHTIETVENNHRHVEELFTTLVDRFGNVNQEGIVASTRHIKEYRKYKRRSELQKMKTYNAYKTAQTWARNNASPLRILYKEERSGQSEQASWLGFDVLSMHKKFSFLKIIQKNMDEICSVVLNLLEQIDKLLHYNQSKGVEKNEEELLLNPVLCFEEGVNLMGVYLEEAKPSTWTKEEIKNFLEVDKIILDSLDLLTLSTATIRTLAHEARHILHITYETVRDLDYLECKVMNTYEEVAGLCKSDFKELYNEKDIGKSPRGSNSSKKSGGGLTQLSRKNKLNKFDIEEKNLESADAEYRFERSLYQDILKELPILCNLGSIKFTLQDAEAVFTESSQDISMSVTVTPTP